MHRQFSSWKREIKLELLGLSKKSTAMRPRITQLRTSTLQRDPRRKSAHRKDVVTTAKNEYGQLKHKQQTWDFSKIVRKLIDIRPSGGYTTDQEQHSWHHKKLVPSFLPTRKDFGECKDLENPSDETNWDVRPGYEDFTFKLIRNLKNHSLTNRKIGFTTRTSIKRRISRIERVDKICTWDEKSTSS